MSQPDYFPHQFLIAMPSLMDANFTKSVIYLYEHSHEGAMGLVINKPMDVTLGNVLQHLDIQVKSPSVENLPVLMGGPIGQEHGFVIHDIHGKQEDDQIIISSSKEILKSIANGQGPENFLVTLGYAGWQPGQLENEIRRNDWLVAPFAEEILFTTPLDRRWNKATELLGIDITQLSDQVGHG